MTTENQEKVRESSDGSTASYYQLPKEATELQHLISACDMNAQIGEIFRACYRYGRASHSDNLRDARKIIFYATAEVERLLALENARQQDRSKMIPVTEKELRKHIECANLYGNVDIDPTL